MGEGVRGYRIGLTIGRTPGVTGRTSARARRREVDVAVPVYPKGPPCSLVLPRAPKKSTVGR